MIAQEIIWGAPQWAAPASIVAIVLAAFVVYGYVTSAGNRGVRLAAATLKVLAIALVAICLVEPMKRGTRPRPRANVLPIMVDTSQSMQVSSGGSDQSRFQDVVAKLGDDAPWLGRLGQSFDVRRYRFDRRLENVASFEEMAADGTSSSLATSLGSLAQRFRDRPVGGAIVFTDGNLTDADSESAPNWAELGFPVYPVVPRLATELTDIRIVDVSVRTTDFESAPTTVVIHVESTGLPKQQAVVQLATIEGKVIEEQTVDLGVEQDAAEVKFRFRPEQSGLGFYRAAVFSEIDRNNVLGNESRAKGNRNDSRASDVASRDVKSDEASSDDRISAIGEATLVNNRRLVTVDRGAGPYRVLYVAGRPNWEFKFLRRAMDADAEIQLVGLIRIANKETKFSFRDRGVSETNPLFAGLGADEEDLATQYDEPVILRFGVKESEELSEGFPDSDEELFSYHGVVLDDVETSFFSQDQLLRLRRFVSARGGGLLMLGGAESFAGKSFADSPLGELSPVYAPRASDLVASAKSDSGGDAIFNANDQGRVSLTREGLLQPWMRLRDTEHAEQERLAAMPEFRTVNPVGDVKPGASRLATVGSNASTTDDRGAARSGATAMAVQRFGKGRTAAIPVGDLWRWSMHSGVNAGSRRNVSSVPDGHPTQSEDLGQAWRQTMRWLVGEVPGRVELNVDVAGDPSGPADLVVQVRDPAYLAMDNASVELVVTPVGGESVTLAATADDTQAGVYRSEYWPRVAGGHRVVATVTAPDGTEVGVDVSGWTSKLGVAEFETLGANDAFLSQLARETGGEVIPLDQLESFADSLPNRKVPVTETWVYPIWHRTWVMLLVIGCLCGEWGLRRWKGLA
ncbi:hypothetical protein K227x_29060 [Rubripirellula lacrimiformis]|uniref:Glutamine amidotransferase domain-containing protein n=1 Tax=Rubripirellula lacrimiformis TaxID=1930273 RepID=A0A517NBK0_9BACT|nr:hypothetical protein [Rubripirellula lacrimiformis]QDT04514.1 hypothetical protein K227x_29060 [Rubripirellula lacrimiformis]